MAFGSRVIAVRIATAALFLLVGASSAATALPYVSEFSSATTVNVGSTEIWLFDLDADPLAVGDVEPGDTILTAILEIQVADIHSALLQTENMTVVVDGNTVADDIPSTPYGVAAQTHSFDVLASATDHQLMVSINGTGVGPFEVSAISVSGEFATAPEPSLALLLALGLSGLGWIGRQRLR